MLAAHGNPIILEPNMVNKSQLHEWNENPAKKKQENVEADNFWQPFREKK